MKTGGVGLSRIEQTLSSLRGFASDASNSKERLEGTASVVVDTVTDLNRFITP